MLSGYRILVVEDSSVIAEDMRDTIEEAEGVVLGPFSGVSEAKAFLGGGAAVDAAILDLSVSDGVVTPLLEALRAKRVPTLVYTGGSLPEDVRRRHPDLRVLTKPVAPARLVAELRRTSSERV